jgi:hypothetical protein
LRPSFEGEAAFDGEKKMSEKKMSEKNMGRRKGDEGQAQ